MNPSGPYEALKDDLGYLQLGRAAECFATLADQAAREGWSHVEYLARVVAEQASATSNRRLAARLRYARFPYRRSIEDFDFDFQPSVDRKLVADMATLRFIAENRPVLFLGQPGCGKTHLAVALATRAVEAGYGATTPPPMTWCAPWWPPGETAPSPPSCAPTPPPPCWWSTTWACCPCPPVGRRRCSTSSTPATSAVTPRS